MSAPLSLYSQVLRMRILRAAFRHLFVPALLAVSVWSWTAHGRAEAWLKDARWGIDFTTAALLLSVAVIWVAEQLQPANPAWNYNVAADPARGIDRFGRDLFYLTIGSLFNGILTGFLIVRCAALAGSGFALWP